MCDSSCVHVARWTADTIHGRDAWGLTPRSDAVVLMKMKFHNEENRGRCEFWFEQSLSTTENSWKTNAIHNIQNRYV